MRNTLHNTVDRMLSHYDTIDISDELAVVQGQRSNDTWAVYERLAGFLVHKVGRLLQSSSS